MTDASVSRMATLHDQRSCRELVSCVTGVVAIVFWHQVPYTEFLNATFLPHLKLLTGMEDHTPFPPLNANTWLREFTSKGDIITLCSVLVFELFAEEHGGTW